MPSDEDLAEMLRKWAEISPFRYRYADTQAEIDAHVADMAAQGMQLAAASNAGLTHPTARLTFLPASAFRDDPGPLRGEGAPKTNKPRRPVKEWIDEMPETPHAE